MAFAATNTSAFPLFTSLATELRDQIWRSALPDELGPLLYFYSYQKQCWGIRPLSPADPEWGLSPSDDEECRKLEFRHKLLDSAQVEVPLFFVNREARKIAQAWIYKHGLEMRVNPSINTQLQSPVFVKSFDPAKDTLYVSFDQANDFLSEFYLLLSEDDLDGRFYRYWANNIVRIAMPVRIFWEAQDLSNTGQFTRELAEMICYEGLLVCLKVLYIIVDAPLELQPANNDLKIQPGWKLDEIQGGGAFVWDHEHGQFNYNRSEQILGEDLQKLFEGIANTIREQIINDTGRSFEVRPVFAVRA